ncbi:MAG: hypothetical protein GX934_03145 [Burkholderiales bacterium]|nr:hypothetical protein [Burkholderiales bacterium]
MSSRLQEAVDRALSGLWSGMSAETILIDLLRVIREETQRPVDAGQEE